VIKFRCSNCAQKLAIDDEGIGAVIACTNCAAGLVVPADTDPEFRPPQPVSVELVKSESGNGAGHAPWRAALMPHLARWMMDKLVQVLLAQRAHLLGTQQSAALQVVELEQRLTKIQEQVQVRFDAYEDRINDLEKQLALKEQENRELIRDRFLIAQRALHAAERKDSPRVDLRDAGFLLRT
jgi:hypothetical protein